MPKVWWLYSTDDELPYYKRLGEEIKEAKHVLSALIYKAGIKGIAIRINSVSLHPLLKLELHIDKNKSYEVLFSPKEAGDYNFETSEILYPEKSIELFLRIKDGIIEVPTSTVGNGMSFILKDEKFIPTTHLSFGLILP